jgi:hypothetical protein
MAAGRVFNFLACRFSGLSPGWTRCGGGCRSPPHFQNKEVIIMLQYAFREEQQLIEVFYDLNLVGKRKWRTRGDIHDDFPKDAKLMEFLLMEDCRMTKEQARFTMHCAKKMAEGEDLPLGKPLRLKPIPNRFAVFYDEVTRLLLEQFA